MKVFPIIRTLLALPLALALFQAPAHAGGPVVVELFTSQGCSSCPPADRLLGELAEEEGVIALAFHVDYWDYLGWKDTFAQKVFTQRQHAYVGQADRSGIKQRLRGKFTPEIVVQGAESLVGHDSLSIAERIVAHQATPSLVDLDLARSGAEVTIRAVPTGGSVGEVQVLMARFVPEATVRVERGENAGRTLVYHQIVTELVDLGPWSGAEARAMTVRAEGALAVILQKGPGGRIVAAAALD